MKKKLRLLSLLSTSLLCCSICTSLQAANTATNAQLKDLQAAELVIEDLSKPALHAANDAKWNKAAAFLPAGAEMTILEGDPDQPGPFLMRIKLPANYQIPAHWNLADEHITVISGTLNLGIGDKLDMHKSKVLPAGSFARIPAKTHHYSFVSEETIVQYHGIGPWGIQYLDPAHNPNAEPQPTQGVELQPTR